ncbi:MAG: ACP S-malonyltransferase [Lachnospira sp.]|nr:ACP S-malonyltransferase [Lachnospira sp.]
MSKTAFMFPGQGAQYAGMGASFYEEFDCCREAYEKACEVTGLDIKSLCFEENEELNKTEYTQIAMYATEAALLKAVQEKGITSEANVGLSLGEYAALTASGALEFEDGCRIVRKRGIYMEQEVPQGIGTMAAILGMTAEQVETVLQEKCDTSKVSIANYNCPGQIVISGEKAAVLEAMEELKASGAKRALELNVSGPFHSPSLKGAGEKLEKELADVNFSEVETPYIANLTAEYVTDSSNIKDLLVKQVYSSVRFEQSVRLLISDGFDTFIEIGPGKTLTGFVKKIAKDMGVSEIRCINIDKTSDLEQLG